MTDEKRERETEEQEQPRVRVTDRRVRMDEGDEGAQGNEAPAVTESSELEAARRQAAEYRDHLQRLQAEFDNYRKRVLKEQTRAVEMAAEPVVRRLLEVLDEFDLALMAAEQRPMATTT